MGLALTILIAPLVGFLIQYTWGRKLPRQGDLLTVAAIGVSMVASIILLAGQWSGDAPISASWDWLQIGGPDVAPLTIGIFIDGLTATMLFVVTLVAFLVHVFSMGYMHGDPKYPLFFAWLQMFSFSMLILVLSNNLLHLFMGWELVGLCSYKLIGFWSEKPAPCNAARKAFITTRIGDLGMMVAIFAIWQACESFEFSTVFAAVSDGTFSGLWLEVAGFGLLMAAVGKSAQVPLHVWLPDAMEGPTPVSALIHAATMVAAGVYLMGRMTPILTVDVMTVMAVIGAVTGLMAGLVALAQDDIKKVLAYSTVSQLGYMFLGLGCGAWHAGLFHLTTHAFFKALMFLGSGSVIHACHHEQDMRKMGGLWKKLPLTGTTFFIGVLAIAGFPFLSGWFSKDAILAAAYQRFPPLFWMGLASAVLTAFYMGRLFVMTFMGKPKDQHIYDHAHEGGMSLKLPLLILAVLSVIAGFSWHKTLLDPTSILGADNMSMGSTSMVYTIAGEKGVDEKAYDFAVRLATLGGLLGLFFAWLVFGRMGSKLAGLKKPFAFIETAANNKFWFDEFYRQFVLAPGYAIAQFFSFADAEGVDGAVNGIGRGGRATGQGSAWADFNIVDGLVRLLGGITMVGGSIVSALQSGRVRLYLSLSAGVIALTLVLKQIF